MMFIKYDDLNLKKMGVKKKRERELRKRKEREINKKKEKE
jgi:hypothetical protein